MKSVFVFLLSFSFISSTSATYETLSCPKLLTDTKRSSETIDEETSHWLTKITSRDLMKAYYAADSDQSLAQQLLDRLVETHERIANLDSNFFPETYKLMVHFAQMGLDFDLEETAALKTYVNSVELGRRELRRAFHTWYHYFFLYPNADRSHLTPKDYGHRDIYTISDPDQIKYLRFTNEQLQFFRKMKDLFDRSHLPQNLVLYRGEVVPPEYIPQVGQIFPAHTGVVSTTLSTLVAKNFMQINQDNQNYDSSSTRVLKVIKTKGNVEGVYIPYFASVSNYKQYQHYKTHGTYLDNDQMHYVSPTFYAVENEVILGPSSKFEVLSVTQDQDEQGAFLRVEVVVTDD